MKSETEHAMELLRQRREAHEPVTMERTFSQYEVDGPDWKEWKEMASPGRVLPGGHVVLSAAVFDRPYSPHLTISITAQLP
jgi:hypothetical protein